ncbi:MAG: hypothetical protein LBL52_02340 [Rickettsiales bacterium]|jgi:hypothetical protein|nr:hypothetical protein [Rickettsiales bacterium]
MRTYKVRSDYYDTNLIILQALEKMAEEGRKFPNINALKTALCAENPSISAATFSNKISMNTKHYVPAIRAAIIPLLPEGYLDKKGAITPKFGFRAALVSEVLVVFIKEGRHFSDMSELGRAVMQFVPGLNLDFFIGMLTPADTHFSPKVFALAELLLPEGYFEATAAEKLRIGSEFTLHTVLQSLHGRDFFTKMAVARAVNAVDHDIAVKTVRSYTHESDPHYKPNIAAEIDSLIIAGRSGAR